MPLVELPRAQVVREDVLDDVAGDASGIGEDSLPAPLRAVRPSKPRPQPSTHAFSRGSSRADVSDVRPKVQAGPFSISTLFKRRFDGF